MLRKLLVSLSLVTALILTGCATPYDVDIAKENTSTYKAHTMKEAKVLTKKVESIKDISTYECTTNTADCGAARAFMKVFAVQSIERVQGEKFDGPQNKTGVDVQHKVAENGVPLAAVTGGAIVSRDAVKSTQKQPQITSEGDVNYNYEETHNTAVGHDNQMTQTAGHPSSVTEMIPEVPAEETAEVPLDVSQ